MFKKRLITFVAIIALVGSLFISTTVFAATPSLKDKINKQNNALSGDKGANLGAAKDPRIIATGIIKVVLGLVATVLVVYFIYGGFMIMTAAGNSDQVDKGKTTIRNGVIGLLIVLSAYSITIFVTTSILGATTGSSSGQSSQDINKILQEKI